MSRLPRPPGPTPRCPVCRRPAAWAGNPARPFCSTRCQLVDLGRWLDETYRIPTAPGEPAAEALGPDE